MDQEPIRRSLPSEISAPEGGGKLLRGIIPYDSPSAVIAEQGKVFREVIRKGAFARALSGARDVISTFNHDPNRLLGRTSSGTLRLTDTPGGLTYVVQLPESAADIRELLARGDLKGSSFMARPMKGGQKWTAARGAPELRELTDLDLIELGPVAMPAYPESDAEYRSLDPPPPTIGQLLPAALVRLMERTA